MTELTLVDARKAIRWFQKTMGLQDWKFRLWIQDEPPEWADPNSSSSFMGRSVTSVPWKSARIWVSPSRAVKENEDPLATLFHETLHTAFWDCGVGEGNSHSEHVEFLLNRLGTALLMAYQAENK